MPYWPFETPVASRCVVVALIATVGATADAYALPGEIRFQYWTDSELNDAVRSGEAAVPRNEYYFNYQWGDDDHAAAVTYAHQPILIRSGEPAHNGYFHLLDGTWRRRWGNNEIELVAGVHGSSNMFRHGEYHSDVWVGGFRFSHQLSRPALTVGLNGDHRFGHFQIYPRLAWRMNLSAWGALDFDLPVSAYWQSGNRRWQVGFERYGEKWATLDDREVGIESALYIEEWRFGVRWRSTTAPKRLAWQLGAGISFDTQVEFLDLNRGRRESEMASAWYMSVGLGF